MRRSKFFLSIGGFLGVAAFKPWELLAEPTEYYALRTPAGMFRKGDIIRVATSPREPFVAKVISARETGRHDWLIKFVEIAREDSPRP